MEKLRSYYAILDVEPGASFEEIRQAYRDLAYVWNPDQQRFEDVPRLRQKATEKIREINDAYEKLAAFIQDYGTPVFSSADESGAEAVPEGTGEAEDQRPAAAARRPAVRRKRPGSRRMLRATRTMPPNGARESPKAQDHVQVQERT